MKPELVMEIVDEQEGEKDLVQEARALLASVTLPAEMNARSQEMLSALCDELEQLRRCNSVQVESIQHLQSQLKAQQWQSIETAPKDGRTLLLGYRNSSDKWRTVRGQWFTSEEISEWENADDFEASWYETSVENDEPPNCWLINPTHWMPLPDAPKGE